MKNLLKYEFTRLATKKSFYICAFVMLVLEAVVIIAGSLTAKATGNIVDSVNTMVAAMTNSNFAMIAGIFVVLFVCEDYEQQIVKNIYSRGYSRTNVYLAKLVVVFVAATIMFLLAEAVGLILGNIMCEKGDASNLFAYAVVGTQYVAMLANVSLAFLMASAIRKNGGAIAAVIVVPMVMTLLLNLADVALKAENFRISDYWVATMLDRLTDLSTIQTKDVWRSLIGSLVYIPALTSAGIYLNKKVEI